MNENANILKRILLLAVPTFGQLVAEPTFIIIDTAIVGHVSEAALAGLAVGSTLVLTAVGLCIFLAYATTSQVSRLFGAGDTRAGLQMGMNNIWLSLCIGVILAVVLFFSADALCGLLGAKGLDLEQAAIYTRAVVLGVPGMLLVYAANGLYRGLQKIRITLVVAIAGAVLNTILDVLFVIAWGWGIGGSGFATFIAQWFMGIALLIPVIQHTRAQRMSLRPRMHGIAAAGKEGLPLFIRTVALRVGIIATVIAASTLGTEMLAGYQVVNAGWNFVLNILDSVAIAGQTLVGAQLGAANRHEARRVTRLTMNAGLGMGVVIGVAFIVVGFFAPQAFTDNPDIQHLATIGMVVTGIALPMQSWMWAADGILIGAGDFHYLAWTCAVVTCVYLLILLSLTFGIAPLLNSVPIQCALLWTAFDFGLMGGRAITNGLRIRSDAWMRIEQ